MATMMQLGEAADYLGVSRVKMWQMVRDGLIAYEEDALDRRVKLFQVSDLNKLKKRSTRKERKTA
jgi:hypothetical protein